MNQCTKHLVVNEVIHVSIQVILMIIFLNLFFFTYVVQAEKYAFQHQIKNVVNSILNTLDLDVNKKQAIMASNVLKSLEDKIKKDSQAGDDKILKRNKAIFNKAILYSSIAIGIIIVIVMILKASGYCIPVWKYVKENMYIIFFLAIIEIVFLNLVAKKYQTIDSDVVKSYLVDALKDYGKK